MHHTELSPFLLLVLFLLQTSNWKGPLLLFFVQQPLSSRSFSPPQKKGCRLERLGGCEEVPVQASEPTPPPNRSCFRRPSNFSSSLQRQERLIPKSSAMDGPLPSSLVLSPLLFSRLPLAFLFFLLLPSFPYLPPFPSPLFRAFPPNLSVMTNFYSAGSLIKVRISGCS